MIWSVSANVEGSDGWQFHRNWNAPKEINTDLLNMQSGGGHVGGIDTTVSMAAGDIDRDGREDIVLWEKYTP
ncbi:hypothetical protein FACS1894127_3320 [Clostridia bacterium]|nr:hypothetical protein FACS1894127_3320 [Clostridia bacterium]